MKQIIGIILIAFIMLWYAGVGKISVHTHENKTTLSTEQIRHLDKKNVLKKPVDYNKVYYTTHKVEFLQERRFIPFTYKRDTLFNAGLQYFSK